jgi:hypothetical protein
MTVYCKRFHCVTPNTARRSFGNVNALSRQGIGSTDSNKKSTTLPLKGTAPLCLCTCRTRGRRGAPAAARGSRHARLVMKKKLPLIVLLLGTASAAVAASPSPVSVTLPGGGKLVAAVGSGSSFRLGVTFETEPARPGGARPLPSPSVEATPPAPSTTVEWGGMTGLQTSFGALLVSPAGGWALYDAANQTILQGTAPVLTADNISTIQLPVTNGTGMHGGAEPCLANGKFAPNYYWDSEAGFLAFAVSPWDSDPVQPQAKYVHCYPAGFADADGGYADPDRDWVNVAQGITTTAPRQHRSRTEGTCAPMQPGTDLNVGHGSVQSGSYPHGTKVAGGPAACCKACDAAEAKYPNSKKGCKAWVATSDGKPDGSGNNCWPYASVSGAYCRACRSLAGQMHGSCAVIAATAPFAVSRVRWI